MSERRFRIQGAAGLKMAFRSAYDLCQQLMGEGAAYELVLRPMKSKRSIEQNKRYWLLLREIAATAWLNGRQFSDETWHEFFKRTFIGCDEIAMPDGTTELRGISTTKLKVDEFGDYMLQIEQWAAEQGFPVMEKAA